MSQNLFFPSKKLIWTNQNLLPKLGFWFVCETPDGNCCLKSVSMWAEEEEIFVEMREREEFQWWWWKMREGAEDDGQKGGGNLVLK